MHHSSSSSSFRLSSGDEIPSLGLGLWKSGKADAKSAVLSALRCGYRHLDCASGYGNESEVGDALRSVDHEIPRREIWITTKLWNDSHDPSDVEPACRASLRLLQATCLDLYLVHWPYALRKNYPTPWSKIDLVDDLPIWKTWSAMCDLVTKGLVRNVGVCNVGVRNLRGLLEECSRRNLPVPAVNQVELHPYLPQESLVDLCVGSGIHVTAYSALGSNDRPSGRFTGDDGRRLLEDPVLREIARGHGATAAQVALRWGVQRGTSVLAKSVNEDRIRENLRGVADPEFELSGEEMERITRLGREHPHRFITHTGSTDPEHVPEGHVDWLWA